jgi:UDP-N-acetylglucosamine diphosphorylase / glucose-1-phosphate thymidylyltransferase / UDP-N-acetylgalactosamine diphosphorylase / glucosamine-1-phosphate N-acetyltransferase / galactosamine-1-phosphate N-acetyltransferase
MPRIVIFEDAGFANFLPLTYWRSVASMRVGRKSLMDNAASRLGQHFVGLWARRGLTDVIAERCQIPTNRPLPPDTVLVNGRWLLSGPVAFQPAPFVATCKGAIAYIACDSPLAERLTPETLLDPQSSRRLVEQSPSGEVDAELIQYPWELVERNEDVLRAHWTPEDRSIEGKVSSSAYLINGDDIHVGERTVVKPTAVIDAENGPVFISNDVLVDTHVHIQGPAYIGPGTIIKPFTHIRPGTTTGAMCNLGGEISRTIMAGYASKQHDGFLGNAYLGSWVNLGAGTSNSNLKNTFGEVRVHLAERTIPTGQRYVGCVLGDFARLSVGTTIPTGALVGFAATCSAGGMLPHYVPSFAWLAPGETAQGDPARVLHTVVTMLAQRKKRLSETELALFREIPQMVGQYRV